MHVCPFHDLSHVRFCEEVESFLVHQVQQLRHLNDAVLIPVGRIKSSPACARVDPSFGLSSGKWSSGPVFRARKASGSRCPTGHNAAATHRATSVLPAEALQLMMSCVPFLRQSVHAVTEKAQRALPDTGIVAFLAPRSGLLHAMLGVLRNGCHLRCHLRWTQMPTKQSTGIPCS